MKAQNEIKRGVLKMTDSRKLENVLSDKSFLDEIMKMKTAEEVQVALREQGLELSIDEINKFHHTLTYMASHNGLLSQEALEEVAGGLSPAMSSIIFKVLDNTFKATAAVAQFAQKIDVGLISSYTRW